VKARPERDGAWLFGLALSLRLAVALYAADRFPPADDGSFYHVVAQRIAQGAGYTWAWPDGAITYAAHYPVGYPALLGVAYALFGASPLVAMALNAVIGALLVWGAYDIARRVATPRRARLAGLVLALHPTLLLYSAALMTELPAATLLVLLVGHALRLGERRASPRGASSFWASVRRLPLALGGVLLLLIRPQLLPMLAVIGALAVCVAPGATLVSAGLARVRAALEVTLVTLLLVMPWTLRNCRHMDGCVFVSANGGWNLLIGTLPEGKGSFAPIAGANVPVECREVFGEAGKDRCFGHAGARRIREQPWAWLSLAPLKLGQLFDHGAVASSYLHSSNPALVGERAKLAIAAVETFYSRLLLLGACLGLLRAGSRRSSRYWALGAILFGLSPWGYLAELALLGGLLAERPTPGRRPLWFAAAALLGLCVVTHVVFFGAARYALVWLPWLPLLMVGVRSAATTTSDPPASPKARRTGPIPWPLRVF
jgi:hypothetical protein